MITLDRDARLEGVREVEPVTRVQSSARLVASSISTTTPWLASALSALYELQTSGGFEPGVGDLSVSPDTVREVGRVLGSITLQWLPIPDVTRLSGGGIVLRWAVGNQEVEVAVLPRRGTLLSTLSDGEVMDSWQLPATDYLRVNDELKRLMGPS